MKKYKIISLITLSGIALSSCNMMNQDTDDNNPESTSKKPAIEKIKKNSDNSHNDNTHNNSSHSTSSSSTNTSDNDTSSSDTSDNDNSDEDNSDFSEESDIQEVFNKWIEFDKQPLEEKQLNNKTVHYFIAMNNKAIHNNQTIGKYAKDHLSSKQRTILWKVPKIIGLYDLMQFDYSNPEQLSIVASILADKEKLYYKENRSTVPKTKDRSGNKKLTINVSDIEVDGDTATLKDGTFTKKQTHTQTYINSFKKKKGQWKVYANKDYTHIVNKFPVTMGYDPFSGSPESKSKYTDDNYYPDMSYDNDK